MSEIINPRISKVKIAAMMLLILLSSIWFALASQPVRVVIPDAVVMKRESLELDPAFEEALNVSMKRGYCQAVNWDWAEVSNE